MQLETPCVGKSGGYDKWHFFHLCIPSETDEFCVLVYDLTKSKQQKSINNWTRIQTNVAALVGLGVHCSYAASLPVNQGEAGAVSSLWPNCPTLLQESQWQGRGRVKASKTNRTQAHKISTQLKSYTFLLSVSCVMGWRGSRGRGEATPDMWKILRWSFHIKWPYGRGMKGACQAGWCGEVFLF